jgi:hypothetical protein
MSHDLIEKWKAYRQDKSDIDADKKLTDFCISFRNSLFFLEIVPIPEEGAGQCLRFIPSPEGTGVAETLLAYLELKENEVPASILEMMENTERDFTPADGNFILSIVDKYNFNISINSDNNQSELIPQNIVHRLSEISIKLTNDEKAAKKAKIKKVAFIILPLIALIIIGALLTR